MKYYVAQNLNHDRHGYVRGDEVELPENIAERLLQSGVIQSEPVVDPVSPANLDRVQRSPAKPGREPKKDLPLVGGEPTQTGEPSVDGPQEPQTAAEDVTPKTGDEPETDKEPEEAASVDVQPEAPTSTQDVTPETPSNDPEDVDPSANL